MSHTTQEETQEGDHLRRALLPTLSETITLMVGSFLFLLGINALPAFKNTVDGRDYSMFSDFIKTHVEKLLAPTNNQQGSTVLTVAFWMVIGIMSYLIVWIIASTISSYRNDVTASKGMVMPQGVSRRKASHEILQRMLVRIFATIMFLYWLYLLFASILPQSSSLFLENIGDIALKPIGLVLLGTAMLAASVFVAMIYARCIVLRERVFGS